MNAKAYHKSLEQGELWTLHPETGRLIPADPSGSLISLKEESAWYVAEVAGESGAAASREVAGSTPDLSSGSEASAKGSVAPPGSTVLGSLQALIDRRREELPEGSYTTHLFTKGSEKIRKKTGEEAVELILASSKENLVYEAADLLYHLMVLLSAENLSIEAVLEELSRRHAG